MSVIWFKMINFWRVFGIMSIDKRGLGFNFILDLNILVEINMYIVEWFYRLY